jgi:hypothetical protein
MMTPDEAFGEPPNFETDISTQISAIRIPDIYRLLCVARDIRHMKIGEPTGEMTECEGWDIDRDTECKNLVRVLHDPRNTAQLALCAECNASGELYGPLDEPYYEREEEEHKFRIECCAGCRQYIAGGKR